MTARLWDAESGKELAKFSGPSDVWSAALSPDGRRILTASGDNTLRLWDAQTEKKRTHFTGHFRLVNSAVFNGDGRRVLTASDDDTVRLWDAESGKELAQFSGHTTSANSAVFSPDERRVLTASDDNTAQIFPVLPSQIAPPDWFGDFLIWVGGTQIGDDGIAVPLTDTKRSAIERSLEMQTSGDSDYVRLLRWCLARPAERMIEPYAGVTRVQRAAQIVDDNAGKMSLDYAYALNPHHPLIHLALAAFTTNPVSADFLRRYSLDRLPDDPPLQLRAAELLQEQKQPAWAMGFVERALFHRPDDEKARVLRDALRSEIASTSPEASPSPKQKTP